jgi:hypothetical protein
MVLVPARIDVDRWYPSWPAIKRAISFDKMIDVHWAEADGPLNGGP